MKVSKDTKGRAPPHFSPACSAKRAAEETQQPESGEKHAEWWTRTALAAARDQMADGMGRMGGMGRTSFSDVYLKMGMAMRAMHTTAVTVLRFQAAGSGHQPPAGDQTHLGYGNRPPPP